MGSAYHNIVYKAESRRGFVSTMVSWGANRHKRTGCFPIYIWWVRMGRRDHRGPNYRVNSLTDGANRALNGID